MRKRLTIFVLLFVLLAQGAKSFAQSDSARVVELSFAADDMYKRKSYDSALVNYFKALDLVKKNQRIARSWFPILHNFIGDVYRTKGDNRKAHDHFLEALQYARSLNTAYEKDFALTNLFKLHQTINQKDLSFQYPSVTETELADVWFPLLSFTEQVADSIDVVIAGGTLDGIGDSLKTAELFMHISPKDTVHHKDLEFYGNGRILKVGANNTLIRVKKQREITLLKGDFTILKASVPLAWRKLTIRDYLLKNLYLVGNYGEPLFHYRFLYYYTDKHIEQDIFDAMKSTANEIVEMFGEDTLTNPAYAVKNKAGIFEGLNMMRAIHISGPEHIQLFLGFVKRFPAKYIGNNYKFAETYATWMISNTPLDPAGVKPYLLSLAERERFETARKLADQVRDDRLIDDWLDEGMQQLKVENTREALITAKLMQDVSAIADSANIGWGDYLEANIQKRLNNRSRAEQLLTSAEKKFQAMGQQEGLVWARNTRSEWQQGNEIRVDVQNGHILPYVIAQSNDPRYFATGSSDNLIKIWDRTLGKEIKTLKGHNEPVNDLKYSPNGRYLASVSDDQTIRIWNAYNYTLLYSYNTPAAERAVVFTPDNKFVVTGGEDSVIRFRELSTGKVVKELKLHKGAVNGLSFHPIYTHVLYSAGSDSMVYKWDINDAEMKHWYRHKGKALSVKLSNNGQYMSVVSTDSVVQVWQTEEHKKLFWGKIYMYRTGLAAFYASESFTTDSRHIAYPHRADSFLVIRIKDLYERVYPAELKGHRLMDLQFTNDGQAMFARYDLGGPLRVYNFVDWDIQSKPTISFVDINPYGNIITSVQFSNDDNGLIVLHSEVSRLDLRNGNNERLYYGYSLLDNPHILLEDERIGTYIDNKKPIVYFYDYGKLEILRQFGLPDEEEIAAWELAPRSRYVYIGSKSGMIGGWNGRTAERNFLNRPTSAGIRSMKYNGHNGLLYVLTENKHLLMMDAATGSISDSIEVDGNHIACTHRYIYVSGNDGHLYKYSASDHQLLARIRVTEDEPLFHMAINPAKNLLALISYKELFGFTLDTDSLLYRVPDHEFANTMVAMSHDGRRIATAGLDSKVNLYDSRTGELLVHIHYPMDKGVLISDKEGHYLASRHTLDAILFTYNNTAYSFDQFDLRLNRPDLVLETIGRADTLLLASYQAAFRKRLSRFKLQEDALRGEMQLPFVRLRDRYNVQTVTTSKELELEVECSDSRFPLRSLQVLVNNSPILGVRGRDLSGLDSKFTVEKLKIPLSQGLNTIKVFCTNAQGVISLQERFEVISKYTPEKPPKVYFIGIGAANYKDSRMNLQYSAKDIRDLAATFNDLYANISIDTLIDSRVTKENILALKKKLLQTTVNDRVILAVTGHGLLSDSLDFYYATWDVDFSKPEKRGLKYELLEDLLNDIPARQKLMLIDACHSGALDKEELLALRQDSTTVIREDGSEPGVKGIAPRGFGLKTKQKMEANSSFELMQSLFTDLSESNGAVIISAAGGMEYAFESGEWNNGVFTYCVRKGIEEKAADRAGNFDGWVSVQELLQYVSAKVSELTRGKQKPTSRRENIDFEWMLRY